MSKYPGAKKRIGHLFGYLSMLGATVVTLLEYFYNDVIIWVWLLYGIVIVPLVAASAIIAVRAFFARRRTHFQRIVAVWGVLNLLLAAIVVNENQRTARAARPDEMVAYYHRHADELRSLAAYARDAIDPGAWMYLEFERDEVIHFSVPGVGGAYGKEIDVAANCRSVGLSAEEFDEIRRRLKALHCISVDVSRPAEPVIDPRGFQNPRTDPQRVTIGRVRWMMSKYDYGIFLQPVDDSLWNSLVSPSCCDILPVNDSLVLVYGSPAFGSICFPNREGWLERWQIKKSQGD